MNCIGRLSRCSRCLVSIYFACKSTISVEKNELLSKTAVSKHLQTQKPKLQQRFPRFRDSLGLRISDHYDLHEANSTFLGEFGTFELVYADCIRPSETHEHINTTESQHVTTKPLIGNLQSDDGGRLRRSPPGIVLKELRTSDGQEAGKRRKGIVQQGKGKRRERNGRRNGRRKKEHVRRLRGSLLQVVLHQPHGRQKRRGTVSQRQSRTCNENMILLNLFCDQLLSKSQRHSHTLTIMTRWLCLGMVIFWTAPVKHPCRVLVRF